MKIVVLAGGLSTERQVALTSGTGVCRALRERGHQAILVDMFLGLEGYEGALADIFDAPDGLLPVSADGHHCCGCPAVHGQMVFCLHCFGNHGFLCYHRGYLHDSHDYLCSGGSGFCCYYSHPARFSAVLPESELLLLPVSQPVS